MPKQLKQDWDVLDKGEEGQHGITRRNLGDLFLSYFSPVYSSEDMASEGDTDAEEYAEDSEPISKSCTCQELGVLTVQSTCKNDQKHIQTQFQ